MSLVESAKIGKRRHVMPKVKRQEDIVRAHLELNGTITSMEAFERYHITRLAGIIYRLRKTMDIETITLHGHDQYGVYTQYAEYKLEEPLPTDIGNDSKGGDNVTDSTSEITT